MKQRFWANSHKDYIMANIETTARGPRFKARNDRIRWMIKHKNKVRRHLLAGTLRDLIREMKKLGLYASTTATVDIEMGFHNLIYCVEEQINERLSGYAGTDLTLGRTNIGIY